MGRRFHGHEGRRDTARSEDPSGGRQNIPEGGRMGVAQAQPEAQRGCREEAAEAGWRGHRARAGLVRWRC